MSSLAVTLEEWQTRNPQTEPALADYVLSPSPQVRQQVETLRQQHSLVVTELRMGIEISSSSYVGRVRLGDLQVTIVPKLRGAPLWQLFRYAYGLHNLRLHTVTDYGTAVMPFQDMLIAMLLSEAEDLVRRGLHRRYRQRATPLSAPRGRIDMPAVVRAGNAYTTTLPCLFYERSEDHPLNQMLLAGLQLATTLTDDRSLRSAVYRLIHRVDEVVSRVPLTGELLRSAARFHSRLTHAYEPAQQLIHLLLSGMGIPLDEREPVVSTHGFLFDMNRFFQALLARFLHAYLPAYHVATEVAHTSLFRYHPEHNPLRKRAPVVRPDIVVSQRGQTQAILDAKYRDLWVHDLPRDMLYQLSLYALCRREQRQAVILYPTLHADAEDAVIVLTPYDGMLSAQVILRPVQLMQLADLLSAPNTPAVAMHREQFAKRLALGRW